MVLCRMPGSSQPRKGMNMTQTQLEQQTYYVQLCEKNQHYLKQFLHNPLMKLIEEQDFSGKQIRDKLLSAIQVFSNNFQRSVMIRRVLNDNARFETVVNQHLRDEYEHDLELLKDRQYTAPVWDAVLEATTAWFIWKMFTLDHLEKSLMMHMVLETSADAFFPKAHAVLSQYEMTNYFQIHSEFDHVHASMDTELFEQLTRYQCESLMQIQKQAWDMVNIACARIAILTF